MPPVVSNTGTGSKMTWVLNESIPKKGYTALQPIEYIGKTKKGSCDICESIRNLYAHKFNDVQINICYGCLKTCRILPPKPLIKYVWNGRRINDYTASSNLLKELFGVNALAGYVTAYTDEGVKVCDYRYIRGHLESALDALDSPMIDYAVKNGYGGHFHVWFNCNYDPIHLYNNSRGYVLGDVEICEVSTDTLMRSCFTATYGRAVLGYGGKYAPYRKRLTDDQIQTLHRLHIPAPYSRC